MAQNGVPQAQAPFQHPHQPQAQPEQPAQLSTRQIQQYLDENDHFIAAIYENMNANRLKDCVHYQERLQKNLMYLAAIADHSPQPQQ